MDKAAMERALSQNVEDGTVEMVGLDENGEFLFKLTEAGERRVRELAAERGLNLDDLMGLPFVEFAAAFGMDVD